MFPDPPSADLGAVLQQALRLLAEGAANPGSAWRTMALGSVGLDGAPQVRSVVLRGVAELALEVHTDARSAKHAELTASPAATLHGWDPAGRVQLRASGIASLHTGDAVAREAWDRLRPASRQTYLGARGPGSVLEAAAAVTRQLAEQDAAANVFCVIRLTMRTLEWLHLDETHSRARFTWTQGRADAHWLEP